MPLLLSLRPPPALLSLSHKYCSFFSHRSHSLSFSPNPSRAFFIRSSSSENPAYVDEWGDKSEPEPEPTSRFSSPDPPKDDDEWGNGSPVADGETDVDVRLWELKRTLLDTVYGSDSGFRASAEVRAEALELVSQLEAANPTPAPTECPDLIDGNWILVLSLKKENSSPQRSSQA